MAWTVGSKEELDSLDEVFKTSSPRIITIMCAAILDSALETALKLRFVDHEKFNQIMFDPANGALGPYMPKVYLGFLLGMYDLAARNAFSGIAKIRNVFAHKVGTTDYLASDPDLVKGFGYLTLHTKFTHYPNVEGLESGKIKIAPPTTEGDIFVTNFRILRMILLCDKFHHQMYSNAPATPEEMIAYFDKTYGTREAWHQKYERQPPRAP